MKVIIFKHIISFFQKNTCKHEFKGKDMKPRDENGYVTWNCSKCGKIFVDTCGLNILKNGKCIGEWF